MLTAIVVLAALAASLLMKARPADLLDSADSWRAWLGWLLMISGVLVRLWGSGNLRKNQEITDTGIYAIVRHPLYLGSLLLLLAYFLSIGDPLVGLVLFSLLLFGIYYPTMLAEEEHLMLKFPREFGNYSPPPRLLPALRRIPAALRSNRFEIGSAYHNLGFRSAWFLLGLPLLLRIVEQLNAG